MAWSVRDALVLESHARCARPAFDDLHARFTGDGEHGVLSTTDLADDGVPVLGTAPVKGGREGRPATAVPARRAVVHAHVWRVPRDHALPRGALHLLGPDHRDLEQSAGNGRVRDCQRLALVLVEQACNYSWTVTADAQSFVSGSASNYGWSVRDANENGTNASASFFSHEWSSATQGPQLIITYTP